MAKPLGFTEFMRRLSKKCKLSEKTVRKVYDNLFLLMAEELRFTGSVKLKRIGTFTLVQRGGKDKMVPRPDGSLESKFIEPYFTIHFQPVGEFHNYVNGKLVDKEARKRVRKNELNKSDKALLKLTVEDKDRNLEIALEKFAEEVKNGER